MSLRVSEGIGTGTPGRLTPLCVATRRPTTTVHRARPRSTASTRSRTSPSSMSTSWPGSEDLADAVGATGSSPSRAASSAATTISSPRSRLTGAGKSPIRTFGPWRSAMIAIGRPTSPGPLARARSARRALRASRARSSGVRRPCPPPTIARRVSEESDAGPTVATIFVRRGVSADTPSAYRRARVNLSHFRHRFAAKASQPGIARVRAQLLLDAEQLVVLRDAVAA